MTDLETALRAILRAADDFEAEWEGRHPSKRPMIPAGLQRALSDARGLLSRRAVVLEAFRRGLGPERAEHADALAMLHGIGAEVQDRDWKDPEWEARQCQLCEHIQLAEPHYMCRQCGGSDWGPAPENSLTKLLRACKEIVEG